MNIVHDLYKYYPEWDFINETPSIFNHVLLEFENICFKNDTVPVSAFIKESGFPFKILESKYKYESGKKKYTILIEAYDENEEEY